MSEETMSAAEWQVMRVLWATPAATSQQIVTALQEGFDWQPATIKTMLGRLRKKGLLRMEKLGSKYHYTALITEEDHLSNQIDTLLATMCTTKHAKIVEQVLAKGSFSRSAIEQLNAQLTHLALTAPERLTCHCLAGQCTCHCHD